MRSSKVKWKKNKTKRRRREIELCLDLAISLSLVTFKQQTLEYLNRVNIDLVSVHEIN